MSSAADYSFNIPPVYELGDGGGGGGCSVRESAGFCDVREET